MLGTQKSEITTAGSRGGSKQRFERFGFSANDAVGRHSGIVLRLFLALSMVGEDCCGRKIWRGGGGVRDNTLFISIVLEDYSLYALHLAIPPPWGFHLSNLPNIKSHPREEIKTEIASGVRQRTRREGEIGQVTVKGKIPPPPIHPNILSVIYHFMVRRG